MFKHTHRRELAGYCGMWTLSACLVPLQVSVCTHMGFFVCTKNDTVHQTRIISVDTFKHIVQKQTHGFLNLWHLTLQQFPISQSLLFKQDRLHLFPTPISNEFLFQLGVTSAQDVQPTKHWTQQSAHADRTRKTNPNFIHCDLMFNNKT